MVRDIKYIIKRIIIGVGIALILMLFKGNFLLAVNAQTYSFSNYELCSVGYGCSSGTSLPISQSYANVVYSYNSPVILSNGHTYSFSYYGVLKGKNITVDSGYPIINVSYNGSNYQRAYPDRYENLYVTYIGADRYAISWSFDMDIVGNFNIVDITYYFTSIFQNVSISVSLIQSDLDVTDITSSGTNPNQDIINNQNQNTQNIINNQYNNSQNIINNNNSNTEQIIDNQNQNTQDIINNQNNNTQSQIDSQKVCTHIDKVDIVTQDKYFTSNGTLGTSSNFGITDYISIRESNITPLVSFSANAPPYHCYYDYNKTLISCFSNNSLVIDTPLDIPSNAYYVRFSIQKVLNRPQFNICTNGNQALNNSITDDSGVSDSDISDLFGDLQESNSPISDLLTLPITLLQAYLIGFEGICSPYNLGTLYGTNLILPCIDIPSYIGSNLWSLVDALCCIYMIYNIAMLFVSVYEQFTSLDDSMQLLYSPQHANSRVAQRGGTYDG